MSLQQHLDADDRLSIRGGILYLEDLSLTDMARSYGTPLNVISQRRLQLRAREFVREFGRAWAGGPVQVLPSIKANNCLALRRLLTLEGLGCDTFGHGELRAALACGVPPELISVNGSSKSKELMAEAIVAGTLLTLDSLREVEMVPALAQDLGKTARIRLRLRPDYSSIAALSEFSVEPLTIHAVSQSYKPGLPRAELLAAAALLRQAEGVELVGCHAHAGRHRPDLDTWESILTCYVREISVLSEVMGGWTPRQIDVGGGFSPRRDPAATAHAACREPRVVPSVADYAHRVASTVRREMARAGLPTKGGSLQGVPGRSINANAGLHLTTVVNRKEEAHGDAAQDGAGRNGAAPGGVAGSIQRWVETDTSEAFLPDVNIEAARWTPVAAANADAEAAMTADIVGISCGFDVLVPQARLPRLAVGDLLALLDTGAYQDPGSSNFNAMPRPATVLVNGGQAEVVKRAETVADVFARDVVPVRLGSVVNPGLYEVTAQA